MRNEENNGYEYVIGCWVVGWRYLLDIEHQSLVWLSDIRGAGTMSQKLYGFRKILELCYSSMEQLTWLLPRMHLSFSQDLEMYFCSRLMCLISVRVSGYKVIPQSKYTQVTMFSSPMKCTMSSKETIFLKFWPQFDIRSSSRRKIEWFASL